MDISGIISQYDFNYKYAEALVRDVTPQLMTAIPGPGFENHPAFTLGHLVTGSAMMAEDLGEVYVVPDGWHELFARKGPGDPRKPALEQDSYPPRDILLAELDHQHEKVKNILISLNSTDLVKPVKWRFSKFMPTLGDLAVFMCVNHEAMHLGQLAGWRRAMNLPSALATL